MKTATKVRDIDTEHGMVALYKLSEPLKDFEYVVVSAVNDSWSTETYIFGSSESGRVLSWDDELPGSVRGVYDHQVALNHAGYEVEE